MSPDYVVCVPSLWYTRYYVKAKSKRAALAKALNGEIETASSAEYEKQLHPDECEWRVYLERKL